VKAQGKTIPLVVVEEHHEAFYVWHYAIRKGWMAAEGNTLLHFDAHSDMALPRLRRPLESIGDLADLAEFTYAELNIGDFIWPAAYQGLFNRLLWVRYRQRLSEGGWRTILVGPKNRQRTEFFTVSSLASTPYANAESVRSVDYAPMSTEESLKTDQPIVLDIDLDYFCCNEYPRLPVQELETTRTVYEEFHGNPYHFLHFAMGKISVVARDGKYFLIYDDFPGREDPGSPPALADRDEIRNKIANCAEFLTSYFVVPPLIVLCRSVHSGYTPREQSAFVEETLIEHLQGLYNVDTLSIEDVLPLSVVQRSRRFNKATADKGVLQCG
jgi:hypothetical protein